MREGPDRGDDHGHSGLGDLDGDQVGFLCADEHQVELAAGLVHLTFAVTSAIVSLERCTQRTKTGTYRRSRETITSALLAPTTSGMSPRRTAAK